MTQQIRITRKPSKKGEDGHKVISVRIRDNTLTQLDDLATKTNRSRNELINTLLDAAIKMTIIISD